MPGVVYLIGAGPGDPGLITVRGAEVLAECDVVLYDALAHPALLDHLREGAIARFVGKRGGEESEPQEAINEELIALAQAGKTVGRLKGGDPLMFARGAEEALALAEANIPFEIIPGISSPVAVSAYAGIPLTHRDMASSVLFLTGTARQGLGPDGHDWRRLATRAGTICVLMGMRHLREIALSLIENGRPGTTPTAVIQWGARPDQRTVVAPLSEIADRVAEAGLASPALIIIGAVVTLREHLRWFDTKPLFGKRVLVTRASQQQGQLSRKLRACGADPITLPTIAIHPPVDPGPLADAVRRAADYDVVAFTSANGVERFFAELARQGKDARAFGKARVAAIGPGTAGTLASRGITADIVASTHVGEELANAILAEFPPGVRVLLPRAEVAREAFPEAIRARSGTVDVVTAYETRPPPEDACRAVRDAIAERRVDIVTLTSASTVENLAAILGEGFVEALSHVTLASIGPVTTAAASRLGLTVGVTATTYTIDGLLEALAGLFRL